MYIGDVRRWMWGCMETYEAVLRGFWGLDQRSKFHRFKTHKASDSPRSVQTWCDCTIYETARNPGNLSLTPLPVKAENKTSDSENDCCFYFKTFSCGNWEMKAITTTATGSAGGRRLPEICLWVHESRGPCSWAEEAEPSTPSMWCWARQDSRPDINTLTRFIFL